MVTITDEMRNEIDNYRFEHRCKSQTQAINELIERGLAVLSSSDKAEEKQPADIGELSEDETKFLTGFAELSPSNRRILIGILSVLLQEQSQSADSLG